MKYYESAYQENIKNAIPINKYWNKFKINTLNRLGLESRKQKKIGKRLKRGSSGQSPEFTGSG